jgi:integrase
VLLASPLCRTFNGPDDFLRNPQTGNPYWPDKIREDHLIPAGIAAGIERVGGHTFRHTYSCLLREHEVDLKVQQALMRHADIRTTLWRTEDVNVTNSQNREPILAA